RMILAPMATKGEEPVGSMGTDTPLACLSDKPQSLFNYFKQLFAQVTNPPIDPIREEMVMSLISYIGSERNILEEAPENCHMLKLAHPLLTNRELEKLRRVSNRDLLATTLPALFRVCDGESGLKRALDELCQRASLAVKAGYSLLILSDRGVDKDYAPIPCLLALAAVHNLLVREETRTQVALITESGEPREVMHFALLSGYGASAINPYLALESVENLAWRGELGEGVTPELAVKHFLKAVKKGLLKTFSKMGISTLQSYQGAQVFEAIGLNKDLVDAYFAGTTSRLEGIGLSVLASEAQLKHEFAFRPLIDFETELAVGGNYHQRVNGEYHLLNPATISKLQHAVRQESAKTFQEYTDLIDNQSASLCTLRGLMKLKKSDKPVPLEEVEPAKEIVKRFTTGAMSFGSISKEAHETLAIAMNRIGGKSNTGEGGEDRKRYATVKAGETLRSRLGANRVARDIELREGDVLKSKIKQVASGRFGVTAEYLASAEQIQIKIAQGAKPGEGGQLPGRKVSDYIAEIRYSTPGVELISPPPHHDIYSIEDLAQLIHDLKNANPSASISVKLVSEVGVGTVAAGVSKAKSDHVTISGHDGGTGASPWSSIKHAGTPWELGLAETQQTLVLNRLRGRIAVQVDGQIKTGRDVVIGAILGADEFGFATAPLVVSGCILMRKCHLNTCPVGVATQDPVLRRKFSGKPEYVVNYFFLVAEEARELMAQLGVRRFSELIGRTDLLDMKKGLSHWKAKGLDFSRIFKMPDMPAEVARYNTEKQNHGLEKALDNRLIELARPALERGEKVSIDMPIRNGNRAVGTMLSHEIARRYGHEGLPDGTIHARFAGSAGQSFGAFLAKGVTLDLVGDTNDYCGKGLSGGHIIVSPSPKFRGEPTENIITGNVVLYGAIAGEAHFRGVAGERFAVRNSGARAVVEGVGDHGCEYMTGGTVAVLGVTGRNFAAGMSGGIAYVLDLDGEFAKRCNTAMVDLEPVLSESEQQGKLARELWHRGQADEVILKDMIERHAKLTNSRRAREILEKWAAYRPRFVKIFPREYRRALGELAAAQRKAAA
ncbi:MAG: glutamate synthase subunit alpha, partial [Betaproteobacteria bacterium]